MKILKKLFLFSSAIVYILFAANMPSAAKEINFAVASDIHYTVNTESGSGKYANSTKALRGFVDRVNENDYDFVIFLGDNIDKSKSQNLKGFLNIVRHINSPYYLVMGNHDVHKISGLSKEEYLKIVSKNNRYQKKTQGSYYFYPTRDVIVIVLDGVSSGMPSEHGIFSEKTLRWLDSVLEKNKNKKALIFQHVPYKEPYYSPEKEILDKNEYAAVIRRYDNIIMICSGHYHKEFAKKDEKDVYHISAPAMFEAPYYYLDMQIKYKKFPFMKAKDFVVDGNAKPAI